MKNIKLITLGIIIISIFIISTVPSPMQFIMVHKAKATTYPTAIVTAPTEDTIITTSSFTITVTANDPIGICDFVVYVDDVKVATLGVDSDCMPSTATKSFTYSTSGWSYGSSHYIYAVLEDWYGTEPTSPAISVWYESGIQTSVTVPTQSSVITTNPFTITVTGNDPNGICNFWVYVDDVKVATLGVDSDCNPTTATKSFSYTFTSGWAYGSTHTIYAELNDWYGGEPPSPTITITDDYTFIATTTQFQLLNPYSAYINVTKPDGSLAMGNLPITIKDSSNNIIGQYTLTNGQEYITPSNSETFGSGDVAYMTGTLLYIPSQATGTITRLPITTNVTLGLNPNAPKGTSPYVADISVTDSHGNAAMGPLSVMLFNTTDSSVITTGTITNGSVQITLPDYYKSVEAAVTGNSFYYYSTGIGTPQYNLESMIQTQGAPGTDAVANAKMQIIKDYVVNSTAFDYNSASGNYTMNNNDAAYLWTYNGNNVGYAYGSTWSISPQELNSGQFDNENILVTEDYVNSNGNEVSVNIPISKMQFLELWLGLKVTPGCTGSACSSPLPTYQYYNNFDYVAGNYSELLNEPKSFFTNGGTTAQHFVSQVLGELKSVTELGFPAVTQSTWLNALNNLITSLISDFLTPVINSWTTIDNLVSSGVQWIQGLWANTAAKVMGPMIETVKSIVTMVLQQVINTVVQPMLDGQTTSLSTIFGGVSVDTIASYGPSAFSSIETAINSQSSQLSSVGSTMGSMMSSLSVFSGSGTILGPLISMAGPSIMVTVMSTIASAVISSVLTKVFSKFDSTILSNDLEALMLPLGGTQTGILSILDNMSAFTSVTSQPGVVSQDSGTGYVTQSTGSSSGISGSGYPISSLESSSSPNTCDIFAIGTCTTDQFNSILTMGKVALDNSNGDFTTFNTVLGGLVTSIEALQTGPVSLAGTLGIIATGKDILGFVKTLADGPFIKLNSMDLAFIQFMRLEMDFVQFFLSVLYCEENPSNPAGPMMWLWKSGISTVTNYLGLVNDVNTMSPLNFMDTFSITYSWASGMSVEATTSTLQAITQVIGALGAIFVFNEYQNTIPQNKIGIMDVFLLFYIGQRVAKTFLFGLKAAGSKHNSWTQCIFIASIFLNLAQMYETGILV